MKEKPQHQWALRPQADKKYSLTASAGGHPWIFSNDLAHSPQNITAGDLVQMNDSRGRFIGLGYGHPHTLIAFRFLSRNVQDDVLTPQWWHRRFSQAAQLRQLSQTFRYSHRLCFAEADGLPGLVIDRYRIASSHSLPKSQQVFVVQISTAGMERLFPLVLEGLELLVNSEFQSGVGPDWLKDTAVVLARDSSSRRLEGLEIFPKQAVKSFNSEDFQARQNVDIAPALNNESPVIFTVDLLHGQKTGFFLDQRKNIEMFAQIFHSKSILAMNHRRPLRILDLFSYVGQWSAQMASVAVKIESHRSECKGIDVMGSEQEGKGKVELELTIVDASAQALELAEINACRASHQEITRADMKTNVIIRKMDILRDLSQLPENYYDVVICDPPALIKKKKDLPTGIAAYIKLHREAARRLAPGGLFFSSSCSGLLDSEKYREVLLKAFQGQNIQWISRGYHSPDHPEVPQFPQGSYLKSWMGWKL